MDVPPYTDRLLKNIIPVPLIEGGWIGKLDNIRGYIDSDLDVDKNDILIKIKINKLKTEDSIDSSYDKYNKNVSIKIRLHRISFSIFGFEEINGLFAINTEKPDDKDIELKNGENKQVIVRFKIDKDYLKRINKIIESYVPIIIKIDFSYYECMQEYEYILTCEKYILSKDKWIELAYKFGYWTPKLWKYVRYLLLPPIIVIIIIYYPQIYEYSDKFDFLKRVVNSIKR